MQTSYPDFLIELEDGSFLIVEIKDEHLLDDPITLTKEEYAEKMAAASKMVYRVIQGIKAAVLI
ncbi:MAG TPA: hypothetical protein DCG47_12335 [Spirochaetaceae bacterium]|nr:hypothetical protein [Spirochaetaceae bacterium]